MNHSRPWLVQLILVTLNSTEEALRGARHGSRDLRFGFMCTALSDVERTEVSIEAYHRNLEPAKAEDGLHYWEETWFARDLPASPAKLLVAAAGTGREAVALQKQGYQIDVLEPAYDPVQVCRRYLGAGSTVVQGSFDDLTGSVLDGQQTSAADLDTRYDGIILGWGSLNHVLLLKDRRRLLASCHRLTTGPILASFFMDPHAVKKQQTGKMTALGRTLGMFIARRRGLPAQREPVEYTDWGGFIRHFTPTDIDVLAEDVDRTLKWQREGGFPHVTFQPLPGSDQNNQNT